MVKEFSFVSCTTKSSMINPRRLQYESVHEANEDGNLVSTGTDNSCTAAEFNDVRSWDAVEVRPAYLARLTSIETGECASEIPPSTDVFDIEVEVGIEILISDTARAVSSCPCACLSNSCTNSRFLDDSAITFPLSARIELSCRHLWKLGVHEMLMQLDQARSSLYLKSIHTISMGGLSVGWIVQHRRQSSSNSSA